jgi:UDP-2,3-diacylglucosamine pyrophosphatase LpxH
MSDMTELCLCGHIHQRHVKSSTGKEYCVDCHCGDFKAPADAVAEKLETIK